MRRNWLQCPASLLDATKSLALGLFMEGIPLSSLLHCGHKQPTLLMDLKEPVQSPQQPVEQPREGLAHVKSTEKSGVKHGCTQF